MGLGGFVRRTASRITSEARRVWDHVDAAATRAEDGKLFGSSTYGRYINNITGARTTATLTRQARNREVVGTNDVIDSARVMRPTMGWSNATNTVANEAQAAQELLTQRKEQAFKDQVDREREKARLQIAVRVRRGSPQRNSVGQSMAAGLGTTGATSGGSPTFAAMLGL